MTFASNVAPPKIPLRPKPRDWTCKCPSQTNSAKRARSVGFEFSKLNPGYLVRCPVCRTHRPD